MAQIKPSTHEAKGHLYYYPEPSDRFKGLDPYWTIGHLALQEFDGHHEFQTELEGERVTIELTYSKSGFAPRPEDDVETRLYEWELHIDGYGERKCHFNISPRYENMRHYDTGDAISLPFDHLDADEGVTVQFQGSNYEIDDIPRLLPAALQELAREAGTTFNDRYFRLPKGGRIEEIERYVRILRDWNKKLVQKGATFDRLAMLLSTEKGTKGAYKWDNERELYHMHQVRLCPISVGKLIPSHNRGRQIKSYLPEFPGNFEPSDPLYHPKIGVLFRKSLNRQNSLPWDERHDLLESLDETLLNALHWSDIPIKVGGEAEGSNSVFVADDHFSVEGRENSVPLHDDPTPRLEAEQDHLLMTVLRDMTTSDTDIVQELATDGGQDADELSESSGYSLSTIYRALQRLDGLIESRDGHVRFVSQKIAEEIRGVVESAEKAVESAADRAARLFDIDLNQQSNSAFDRWLAEYGAEFIPPADDDDRGKIRIDTVMADIKSSSHPYLPEVMDYLVHAWITDGRRVVDIEEMLVEVEMRNGETWNSPVRTLR